jgi:hypothetical protein
MSFKGRLEVYGANLGVGYVARKYFDSSLGNPLGAAVFGLLDLAGLCSASIKQSKITRIAKGVGSLYYMTYAIPDAIELATGDYSKIPALLLDGSMVYITAKDAIKSYSENGAKVRDDLSSVVNGTKRGATKIKNIF